MVAHKEITILSQKWRQLEMQVHECTFSDILGLFQSIYQHQSGTLKKSTLEY